jgi:hypothetical protein
MTLNPNAKITVTISVIGALIFAGWGASAAFGGKADKSETETLRGELVILREKWVTADVVLKTQLSLLEKMDKRMERIEDKQDYIIQENLKRWYGDRQPPASTPSPNPLGR